MMKTKKSLFLVLAAGSLALSATAFADESTTGAPVDPGHPRVNEVQERQQNQEQRIEKGVAEGTVTKHEAKHLKKNQARIEHHKERAMAKSGGHLTKHQQASINRQQNRANRKINRAVTNKKKAKPGATMATPPATPEAPK
jgi:hypothetical protein